MDALTAGGGQDPRYVLGHSTGELDRLMAQARLVDPVTDVFLREAGLEPGMRVLDVGCGAGDVTFLAAAIVGAAGEVVGVDRSEVATAAARVRAGELSLGNVTFMAGDPAQTAFGQPFDAVIGRYVLQFQAEPAEMVRRLARHVRPGGLAVFHELDWGGVRSDPPVPTHDRCCRWAMETLRRSGTETSMGSKLAAIFVAAGLPVPQLRLQVLVGAGEHSLGRLALVAGLVATLLPEMERQGVATAADVQLETLFERMREEALATGSLVFGHWQFAAWARIGAGAAA